MHAVHTHNNFVLNAAPQDKDVFWKKSLNMHMLQHGAYILR